MHIVLKTPDICSGINDWILRSRALPLTLHIQGAYNVIEPGLSLVDTLSHCSNRLQSLSLVDVSLPILGGLQDNNFQYHRLTQLRIFMDQFDQPLSLLNPTASPERIEIDSMSLRSLQISWNRLISITADCFDLEDLTQLFQQASQMTFCQVSHLSHTPSDFSMPPIILHRLKTLDLHRSPYWDVKPDLLDSLTLPCLQEVVIYETISLTQLPALLRRSSCPLTSLTLFLDSIHFPFDELGPLPGVTDLVIGAWDEVDAMMRLLLEGFLPDLRHLTLRLSSFMVLWNRGVIPLLLDRKRPRLDDANGGRFHKFIVVDQDWEFEWNSEVWERLKKLNATRREDGFEFF